MQQGRPGAAEAARCRRLLCRQQAVQQDACCHTDIQAVNQAATKTA